MILPASLPSERISVSICSFQITMTPTRNSNIEMQNLLYFVSPNYSHLLCIEYIYHYGEFITHPLQSGFNVVFIDFEQVLDHCIREVILADISKHRWEYFICIFYSLYILFYLFPKFQTNSQYRIQTFYGNSAFLKSVREWFSDTRNPFMMGAGGPNIFDTRCTEGSIFVSLENIFLFLSIHGLSCLAFTQNMQRKKIEKLFWDPFQGAHTNQMVTKHIWMQH